MIQSRCEYYKGTICPGIPILTATAWKCEMEAVCLDSTTVKVHPDGTGTLKKPASKALEGLAEDSPPKFIWSPHLTVRL